MNSEILNSKPQSSIHNCHDDTSIPILDYKSIDHETWTKLRALQKLEQGHNIMILFYIILWIVAGAIILTTNHLIVQLGASFFIGCSISGLPIMMHEASHQLLSKRKSLNRFLGFICGAPALLSLSSYISMHNLHHSKTHTEHDPDNIENSAKGIIPLWLIYYIVLVIGVPAYIPTVAVVGYRNANRARRRRILVEYVAIAAIMLTILATTPFEYFLKLWLIPLAFATCITNVRGLAENGLTTGGSVFTHTRTVLSNRFVRFMMCNLNYHIEHHLFPGIPWYNLPKAHELMREHYRIAGSSVYPSYTRFLIDFFKANRIGTQPNVRLITRQYLEEVCG